MIGTLKVSPEEMQAAASELSGYVSAMEQSFQAMRMIMGDSVSYWVGIAGDAHRHMYQQLVAKTDEIIARYSEHITDLNAMAGVYGDAEGSAQSVAEELPNSIL